MADRTKLPPKPSGELLREMAELLREMPSIWDTMDKHFEEVAKPKMKGE